MRRNYSRLTSVEEKKNIRRAVQFGILTLGVLLLLFFFGIPLLAKFAGFIGDIRKSSTPIDKDDKTPPPPPRVSTLPEYTKESNITVKGSTEAGASVKLFFNSTEEEVVAGEDGSFEFGIRLSDGENEFTLSSKDTSGNESQQSPSYKIIFDDETPDLEISSPADGSSYFGSKQRQVTISGTTEPEISLSINDRPITVDDEGKFVYTTTLNDGGNTFWLKATDKADNSTEKQLNVTFSP
jgi:hypothetical protein